jgi:DNA ligase 1
MGMNTMKVQDTSPVLFKRDTTGSIRQWYAEAGTNGSECGWRTIAGLQEGKKVTSEWKIVEEKNVGRSNSTTKSEQASFEMYAEVQKKKNEGYFESLSAIDTFNKFQPMLASKHEDAKYDFKKNVYYAQPKLDGIRCIARIDGLWTRAGKEIVAVPHIREELSVFFQKHPNAILDGELYNHDLKDNFNKITSLVRKTKPSDVDIKETAELVEYHVYDIGIMPDGDRKKFSDRWQFLTDQGFPLHKVKTVRTQQVNSLEEIDDIYGVYLAEGYEGQMIRVDGSYENKRSKLLIKRKEFLDAEFKVIRIEEGVGNWAGYIKRFVLELPDGREFASNVRGTQKILKDLLESNVTPNWATCRYFTPTPDGIPRFPVVTDWGKGQRND